VQTGNTQFESELKKLIAAEIERLRDILEAGMAIKEFADYVKVTGQLAALRMVADAYCDEANTIINEKR
jgi:hypothetical protein